MIVLNVTKSLKSSSVPLKQEIYFRSDLGSQVIVEQFEGSELFIHGLWVLRLLLLHNLSTCFYHRLHLKFHLTQQLV